VQNYKITLNLPQQFSIFLSSPLKMMKFSLFLVYQATQTRGHWFRIQIKTISPAEFDGKAG